MSTPTRRTLLWPAVFVLGLAVLPTVLAQNEGGPARREFEIKSIQQRTLKAPDYSASGGDLGGRSTWSSKPWWRIEVEFDSAPEWADDVQLRYYALVGRGRETQLFTGQQSLINVARGSSHYAAMFIHPTTLMRFGQGQVEAVAVRLFYKGKLAAQMSKPESGRAWWEQYTPVEGFLLAPEQTPWSVIAFQRYEATKPVAR